MFCPTKDGALKPITGAKTEQSPEGAQLTPSPHHCTDWCARACVNALARVRVRVRKLCASDGTYIETHNMSVALCLALQCGRTCCALCGSQGLGSTTPRREPTSTCLGWHRVSQQRACCVWRKEGTRCLQLGRASAALQRTATGTFRLSHGRDVFSIERCVGWLNSKTGWLVGWLARWLAELNWLADWHPD
jgi:hypothetical protein